MHFNESLLTAAVSGVLKPLYIPHLTLISCFVISHGNSDSFSAATAGPACTHLQVKTAAGYVLFDWFVMSMVMARSVVFTTASCIPIRIGESYSTIPPEDAIVTSIN